MNKMVTKLGNSEHVYTKICLKYPTSCVLDREEVVIDLAKNLLMLHSIMTLRISILFRYSLIHFPEVVPEVDSLSEFYTHFFLEATLFRYTKVNKMF